MDTLSIHQHGNYHYHVFARIVQSGEYRGIIALIAHDEAFYNPPVEIPTPTTFKKAHAAYVEAATFAYELISSGAISALVPADSAAM